MGVHGEGVWEVETCVGGWLGSGLGCEKVRTCMGMHVCAPCRK